MNKYCPLVRQGFCDKEKCAWYLVQSKQCAVPLIASELKRIRKYQPEAEFLLRQK